MLIKVVVRRILVSQLLFANAPTALPLSSWQRSAALQSITDLQRHNSTVRSSSNGSQPRPSPRHTVDAFHQSHPDESMRPQEAVTEQLSVVEVRENTAELFAVERTQRRALENKRESIATPSSNNTFIQERAQQRDSRRSRRRSRNCGPP